MKKLYSFILFCALGFSFKAQLMLTQANHAPANGDSYGMYRCDSVNINPGASGNNVSWNFSGVSTFSNLVRNYSAVAVTGTTYPMANVGVASSANDNAYYASSTASLAYYGGNVAFGTILGSLTYTAPAINASYPMGFGTNASTAIGGTIAITAPFPTTGTMTGNSSVNVDGSGTLTLPGGLTYTNALRVLSSQTLNLVSLANATITQHTYNYYGAGIKAPVFSIFVSTVVVSGFAGSTTTQTIVTRNKGAVASPTDTGVQELLSEEKKIAVYPNPSNSLINFVTSYNDAHYVVIYDITGKEVARHTFTADNRVKIDVSKYTRGLYIYKVVGNNNHTLNSGKITVTD